MKSENEQDIDFGYLTHPGLTRPTNQDFVSVARGPIGDISNALLMVVADGMGGHKGGDKASSLAVAEIERSVFTETPVSDGSTAKQMLEKRLEQALKSANSKVWALSNCPEFKGMGTTLVAALLSGFGGVIANVGDSRCYLHRSGKLNQLTQDHSYVNELLNKGTIDLSEVNTHPLRHIITRAIGLEPDVDVDLFPIELGHGDSLLLCSDGLHGVLDDGEIEHLVAKDVEAKILCSDLVEAANRKGGPDNVSVVFMKLPDNNDRCTGLP